MIIDTKFAPGSEVYFLLQNRIQGGIIKEIEIRISTEHKPIDPMPIIIYKMVDGLQLANPEILCATRQEVADELLKQE